MNIDPLVAFKCRQLDRALPVSSAIVYGDIWRVDGLYGRYLIDQGVERVVVVDKLETPTWLLARLERPGLDFLKGDFSDSMFMASLRERFYLGVAFDILLHQPTLLHCLHSMLTHVDQLSLVQPMLEESDIGGTIVYLPAATADSGLHPLQTPDDPPPRDSDINIFSRYDVNHSHWIWGLTRSFLHAAFDGEGFVVDSEEVLAPLPNPRWYWYGCHARRVSDSQSMRRHWSHHVRSPGLYLENWE